jgi:hypothetical protein
VCRSLALIIFELGEWLSRLELRAFSSSILTLSHLPASVDAFSSWMPESSCPPAGAKSVYDPHARRAAAAILQEAPPVRRAPVRGRE